MKKKMTMTQKEYQDLKSRIDKIFNHVELSPYEKANKLDLFLNELGKLQDNALAKIRVSTNVLKSNPKIDIPEWLQKIDCSEWNVHEKIVSDATALICLFVEKSTDKSIEAEVISYSNKIQVQWVKNSNSVTWMVDTFHHYPWPIIKVKAYSFTGSQYGDVERFHYADRLIDRTLEILEIK